MNKADIIVFDFETGGLDPNFHEAIQIAGKAYNCRTLEPYPAEEGGEFCSLMKPLYFDRLNDKALAVNGKTREMLKAAPDQKVVWNHFVEWVMRFNKNRNTFTAPLAAGKNIRNFDLKFVEVLNRLHCPKKEKTILFNPRIHVELEDIIFMWFENEKNPEKWNMDALRDYFGMSKNNAHDALQDCRDTGEVIVRFLKLHRKLQSMKAKDGSPMIKFKGSLAKA
jgi:DNA polymerase III epsilon subunit-like protein